MVRTVTEDDTGLRVYEPPPKQDSTSTPAPIIDIVAIHGIGAHPDDTWSKNVGSDDTPQYVNWLEQPDMLPEAIPNARIMRYGYESRWFGDDTESTVRLKASTIALQLLLQLNIERENFPNRPLIFIAHCFGGLVVLKALRDAFDDEDTWPGIFSSTAGLVFFGTPFRGTEGMKQSEMVAAALSRYRPDQIQAESLRILVPGDEFLQETVDKFLAIRTRLKSNPAPVACFYETKSSNVGAIFKDPAKWEFIVNESSGCLDRSKSIQKYPLARTHFDMNKFGKASEADYKVVRRVIKMMAEMAGNTVEDTRTLLPDDPSRFLALSKRREWHVVQGGTSYNIFDYISDYEPHRTYRAYLRNRCEGTTGWILDREEFRAWLESRSNPCLWLTGKIGCGKTLVTSTVVWQTIQASQKTGDLVAHFFYNHSKKDRLEAAHLFRSYIKQILGHLDMIEKACPPGISSYVKRCYGPKSFPPTFDEIVDEIFIPLSSLLPRTTYVVDGLDECKREEVRKVLKTFQRMTSQHGTKVFISGRESLDVTNFIPASSAICISNEDVSEDIHRFIEQRIKEKMQEKPLTEKESVLEEIKTKLNERADRMILWVSLQLESLWEDCLTDADIQIALANLPKDLNETYDRCLEKINKQQRRFSPAILRWVCAAIEPFKVDQLREALAIDSNTGRLDRDKVPSAEQVLKCCSNLIVRDRNDQVLLAHHSVRQFLLAKAAGTDLFRTGFDLDSAELELGQLCIAHLASPDYALALKPSSVDNGMVVNLNPMAIERLRESIPRLVRSFLPDPGSVRITAPRKTSRVPPIAELPSFFHFAKEQWAPLTRGIAKNSTVPNCWDKFCALAIEPNLSWKWHPWPPLGESHDSHYSGLLGWAIVNRHLPLLDLLFGSLNPKPNADIFNLPFYHYGSLPALHLASRTGDVEITRRLLQVCNLKKKDSNGRTALHHAAETGHTDVALLLIQRKAKLEVQDNGGRTALHVAAENGAEETILALIKRAADINAKNNYGWTALSYAARGGHEAVVQLLVNGGADVNAKDNTGWTALLYAARGGYEVVVQLLLNGGADVDAKSDYGWAALFYAASEGYEAVVRLLLDGGADVNARDNYRQTALFYAVREGYKAVVRLLLDGGVGVNAKDNDGSTALLYATRGGYEVVVQLLLDGGADVDAKSDYGWAALFYAASEGYEAVVRLLLDGGADVNAKDNVGWTPLLYAARGGYEAVVRLLLDGGADVNAKDNYGSTALLYAASEGYEAVVRLLLDGGADVNAKDNVGWTPLLDAAGGGYEAVVRLLLDSGADVYARDNDERTALLYADERGQKAIVRLLFDAMDRRTS